MYDLPHQVNSNPVSCVKPSHTGSERKVYMKKAGTVTFSPACSTEQIYQIWKQEFYFFIYRLLKKIKIVRQTKTVG